MKKFSFHEVHVRGGVAIEAAVAGAKIVETGISIAIVCETVFGTFAVTGKQHVALLALLRQGAVFEQTETLLLLAVEHLDESVLIDIAEPILGKDEVVAGIDVAVLLHHASVSTVFGIHATAWRKAHPVGQRAIEELNEDAPDVVPHPFVEDGTEKAAPLLGRHRERGDGTGLIIVRRGQMPTVGMRLDAFDDGSKLQVGATVLFKEMIEFERIVGIKIVDNGHGIPFHTVFFEQSDAVHDL